MTTSFLPFPHKWLGLALLVLCCVLWGPRRLPVAVAAPVQRAPATTKSTNATLSARAPRPAALSAESQLLARLSRSLTRGGQPALQLADALALTRLDGLVPPDDLHDVACQALLHAQRQPTALPLLRALVAGVARRQVADLAKPCAGMGAVELGQLLGEVPAEAWQWMGPQSAAHGSGLGENGVLEQALVAGPDGALPLPVGRDGPLDWQAVPAGMTDADGRLVLDEMLDRPDDAVVFVQTEVVSAIEQPAVLWLWTAGPARLWMGGRELPPLPAPLTTTGLPADPVALPANGLRVVTLPQGRTRLVVKLAPGGASLAFRLALRSLDGGPLQRVRAESPQGAGPASAHLQPMQNAGTQADAEALALALTGLVLADEDAGGPPLPASTPSPLPALIALSWHGWPFAAALQERLLVSEPALILQAASSAAASLAADAVAAAGLGFAHLAGEPGDRLDRVRWWRRDAADDPALQVEEVHLALQMGKATAAARLWSILPRAAALPDERIAACLVRSDLLRRLSLARPASELLQRCASRWPGVPLLDAALAADAEAAEELREAAALRAGLAARLPGRFGAAAAALQAALAAGDDEAASRSAAKWCAAWPARCRSAEQLARRSLALGLPEPALTALHALPRWLRRAASFELQAQILQRLGRTAEAVAALREADRRSPGRPEVSARLALLTSAAPPWAPLRRDLLSVARSAPATPDSLSLALRQTVVQGLGNGRQDRYEAEVWSVGKGGPNQHQVVIEYAPTETRAEVLQAVIVRGKQILRTVETTNQTVEGDASGLYFDAETLTLTFSGLLPGDRLVAEWRLQDLHPTPFGLVFGELLALGDDVPIVEREVAVLLPAGTPLQASLALPAGKVWPQLPVLPTPVTVKGSGGALWQQWRWLGHQWPALRAAGSMPGPTDVLPYLHVSTFASWQAAAQWYARLVADALPQPGVDAVVRQTALRLTRGLADNEAKVRAIHAYVARQIRYVGLEFGIHSLKPHGVREIVDRRFGDCKDKATLLVALLREVGIDAQVVLVRTSDLGGLHDQTASLGVFNHAIAHVPSLGWWLDATAPHHEPEELPTGDHGATVLPIPRLDLSGPLAEPVRAPVVLPAARPDQQTEDLQLTLQPQADGDVEVSAVLRWRGLFAADARGLLQNAQTRQTTLQERLSEQWPGLSIASMDVAGVEPPADQVQVRLTGVVPHWLTPQGAHWALAPLRPPQPLLQRLLPDARRELPLVLQHGWTESAVVTIVLPEGARLVAVPQGIELTPDARSNLAMAKAALTALRPAAGQPAGVTLRWLLQVPGRVERAQLPAFRRFLQQVDAALTEPLVVDFGPKHADAVDDGKGRGR